MHELFGTFLKKLFSNKRGVCLIAFLSPDSAYVILFLIQAAQLRLFSLHFILSPITLTSNNKHSYIHSKKVLRQQNLTLLTRC